MTGTPSLTHLRMLRMPKTNVIVFSERFARRGQQEFRLALLNAFGRRCVISGCDVVGVLEAAHIRPYRGTNDNHPSNGLLLRSDIHTLFDLNLLGIEPVTLIVRVHPSVRRVPYDRFDGMKLPDSPRLSHDALLADRPLYPGEMAAAGTALLTVMDVSQVIARAHIPQLESALLKVGDKATIIVPGDETPVEGKITVVSPTLDPDGTTVERYGCRRRMRSSA